MTKLIVLGIAVVTAMVASVASSLRDAAHVMPALLLAPQEEVRATVPDVLTALAAVGIDGEALAVAGYDGTATSALLSGLCAEAADVAAMVAASDAVRAATTPAERANAIESLEVARTAFLDILSATINATGSESCQAALFRISANMKRRVPCVYRLLELNEDGWTTLRRALADRAAGNESDGSAAAFLATIEADPSLILGHARCQNNQHAVREAISAQLQSALVYD